MKVDSLPQLQELIAAPSGGKQFRLAAGVHEVRKTLEISRGNIQIEGECSNGLNLTILRRGKTARGSLFTGPLIRIFGVSDIELRNLIVDGLRFEGTYDGLCDHRHPLASGKESVLFNCAVICSPPEAYCRENFFTPFETDLFFMNASHIELRGLVLQHPIKFGVGIGNGVSHVLLENTLIRGGGNGGIWCGFATLTHRPVLPLERAITALRPRQISIQNCAVEDCGASGIYLEAKDVRIRGCRILRNHSEFPFNEEGGQIEIDYKSENIEIRSCMISDAPSLRRPVMTWNPDRANWESRERIFHAVGIEAFGRNLQFIDNVIEGNSHEGIHLNGASQVRIAGRNTRIRGNHAAQALFPELRQEPQQNLSITSLAVQKQLGALARDLSIEGIQCENGIMFWSDGSIPGLEIDNVTIRDCDLRGEASRGIHVGSNGESRSLRGRSWAIMNNRET